MGFHHLANLCYKILKIGWLHVLKSTVIEINHWTKYTNSLKDETQQPMWSHSDM